MQLSDSTFLVYAMNCYDNPSCHDVAEFEEDLKRFQHLRKLFNRYKQVGELRERLILNHLVVLYNVFGPKTTNMVFLKLEGYHECIKPFIAYLNFLPEYVQYNGKLIETSAVRSDARIETELKKI
jgi:hypothetical protein